MCMDTSGAQQELKANNNNYLFLYFSLSFSIVSDANLENWNEIPDRYIISIVFPFTLH